MNLATFSSDDVVGKSVIFRADLDVPLDGDEIKDATRLDKLMPSLSLLKDSAAKIVIIGHIGRPEGENSSLSTKKLQEYFSGKLEADIEFLQYQPLGELVDKVVASENKFVLIDNLRYWKEEEANDGVFAEELAKMGEVFVNDAFASSHRSHASIVGIPKYLSHFAGVHFAKEVKNLSEVLNNPERPLVVLLSGVKKDKLDYLDPFINLADRVLVGGRLPEFMDEDYHNDKVMVAGLIQDKEDITIHSIENFEKEIKNAKTVVVSGPLGKFEEEGHRQGTKQVFGAIVNLEAFKVAGGGDTIAAINLLGLSEKFDWISIGGGAMLEFLTKGTLPGIEALEK